MIHPPKKTCNEKLQALHAMAVAQLDHIVDQFDESANQPDWLKAFIQIQLALIDLMEALLEGAEPE